MSNEEEKDQQEVGSIEEVRPSFENAEEEQAKQEIEQEHDLVSGEIDPEEIEEQRKAEESEAQKDASGADAEEEEDDYLDIVCRRSKQAGGSCGAAKTTLVADNQHSKRYRCEVCKGVWTIQTGGTFPY